ncbi:MAG TPA: GAF domain-containing protein, partial [Acidimicrobiales bacterium]|nr:GAF domain-containing protein [Acidimicrobiales bacterium]
MPATPSRAEHRLAQIENVSDSELASLDVEQLLDELLNRVRTLLEVDTAAILLLDANGTGLVATAARGIEEEVRQGVSVPLRKGFAGRVAAEKRPVVLDRVDETTVVNPLLVSKGIKTMLGVPLLDAGRVVGVLHVGSLTPRQFDESDVQLLQLVADRVTGAVGSRLARMERDAAVSLQRGLLPPKLPEVPGLELSARYVPGGGKAIGGDWYDVFAL